MDAVRLQKAVFVVLLLLAAAQVAYFYPKMPATVASHFNESGKANGFMPRDGFVGIYFFVMALMGVTFFLMPKGILKFPDSMVSLPHKRYWLAPGRRAKTGEMIEAYMNECGNATLVFLLLVFQMSFTANLDGTQTLPERMWYYLAIFMLYMAAWTIRFIRSFKLPPGEKEP